VQALQADLQQAHRYVFISAAVKMPCKASLSAVVEHTSCFAIALTVTSTFIV
jgi:hypothetical protein